MDLDMDLDLDLLGNYPHETIPNSSPPTLLRTDARYPVLTTSFLNKFDVTMNLGELPWLSPSRVRLCLGATVACD